MWSPKAVPRSRNASKVAKSPLRAPWSSRNALSHSAQAQTAFSNERSSFDVLKKKNTFSNIHSIKSGLNNKGKTLLSICLLLILLFHIKIALYFSTTYLLYKIYLYLQCQTIFTKLNQFFFSFASWSYSLSLHDKW